MLHEFLQQYKKEIIQSCKDKVVADTASKPTTALLQQGLPIFYDELIGVLQRTAATSHATYSSAAYVENRIKEGDAAAHGKESLRLGYSISQVVHSYGAVCQAIMEYVQTKSYAITAREFQDLNFSLDCAIAEAVSEFEKVQTESISKSEVERLGFLMHEIRNSLSAASAAHDMIRKGSVGGAGVTSEVLSRSHARMQHLIESAEAEIRLRGHSTVERTQIRLIDIVNEVAIAAQIAGKSQDVHMAVDVNPEIQLTTDRHLLFTALSNLVNNAIKFTKKSGTVSVRGKESNGRVLLEIEDACGGLLEEKMEELFKPFVQKGANRTGMGLGLSLSLRAAELNQGRITVRNIPKKGCAFTIDLPKKAL